MRNQLILCLVLLPLLVFGRTTYRGYSGAPGSSGTCAGTCHGSGGGSVVVSGFPEVYTPNETYFLTIERLSGSSIRQFNGSCRIGDGSENAGLLAAGSGTSTYSVTDETNGIRLSSPNQNSAEFQWTAPAEGTGDVTLYVASLQGSFNGANTVISLSAQEMETSEPAIDTLWSTFLDEEHRSEFVYEALEAEDGSIFLAGGSFGDSSRIIDCASKVSADGEFQWSARFNGNGLGWFKSVCETSDGNYLFGGDTRNPEVGGSDRMIAAKLNASGDTLWTSIVGAAGSSCESVQPASDGGYWLFGYGLMFGQKNFHGIKLSAIGDSVGSFSYGLDWGDYLKKAVPTLDDGFLLAGYYYSPTLGYSQVELMKINSAGDSLWGRLYPVDGNLDITNVARDPEEGFLLCGGYTEPEAEADDYFLMKVDNDGDSLWSKTWGGEQYDYATAVVPVFDGYAIAGYTASFGAGMSDAWIIRTDLNGDSLWSQTFGGSQNDQCWDLIYTEDASFILAGSAFSGVTGRDAWVLKTTPELNLPPSGHERVAPVDGSTWSWNENSEIEFVWSSAIDPNFDEVTYIFNVWAQNEQVALIPMNVVTIDTSATVSVELPVEPLDDMETILWTVQATDGTDTTDALNETGIFTLDYPGDADEGAVMPSEYSLGAFPNPFNPTTLIQYSIPQAGLLELAIYDIQGRLVETLVNAHLEVGVHTHEFDGSSVASGVYFVTMKAASFSKTMKLVLMK